jgi:hypothetical protein
MSGGEAEAWAVSQRALARALGLSIEDWLDQLRRAGTRKTALTAAVVGAAMGRGLGLGILEGLDGTSLAERACTLIDPTPPRVTSPILREAIRRSEEIGASVGRGASRLKPRERVVVPTPSRTVSVDELGPSSTEGTPDAPGRKSAPPEDE